MIKVARLHTLFGLCFSLLGLCLGIFMASSHDHAQHVTHAHIMLLGLVVSLLYGTVYRLWIPEGPSRIAVLQVALHQAGTLVLVTGLFLLYGGMAREQAIGPVMGVASVAVLLSAVLMLWVFVSSGKAVVERTPHQLRTIADEAALRP